MTKFVFIICLCLGSLVSAGQPGMADVKQSRPHSVRTDTKVKQPVTIPEIAIPAGDVSAGEIYQLSINGLTCKPEYITFLCFPSEGVTAITGNWENQTFVVFSAKSNGVYTLVLIAPADTDRGYTVTMQDVVVGQNPDPDPGPDPQPDPQPDPDPLPEIKKLIATVIYVPSKEDEYLEENRVWHSKEIRSLGSRSVYSFRAFSKTAPTNKTWTALSTTDKPFLILSNEKGHVFLKRPLPNTIGETCDIIKRYIPEVN